MAEYFATQLYSEKGYINLAFAKESDIRVLHLGCGSAKIQGATGIDVLALQGVDIVHDLDIMPWPLETNQYDVVVAHNAFEHFTDTVKVMEEIHRVSKPGARVVITVPYFRHSDAFTDPTHKHFFTSRSMNYFVQNTTAQSEYAYTGARFEQRGFWFGWPHSSKNPFARVFKSLIANHPLFYDQYLSLLFPIKIIIWELEKVAPSE